MGDEARLGRLLGRRKALALSLGATGATAVMAACNPPHREPTPAPVPTRGVRPVVATETAVSKTALPARPFPESPTIRSETTVFSEEAWRKLTPLERIQRLQTLSYPTIEKFDARKRINLSFCAILLRTNIM